MDLAFDAAGAGNNNPVTSLTYSHTCSGSNRILFVAVWTQQTSDLVTSVTYNGVAMTRYATITQGAQRIYLYYLIAPATGANNVVISTSSSVNIHSVSTSYTGAKQSGQPDSSGSTVQASGATLTLQTAVVGSNCWLVSCFANEGNGGSAGAGTTNRTGGSGIVKMGDSNGRVAPGPKTMVWTPGNSADDSLGIIISLASVNAGGGAFLSLL